MSATKPTPPTKGNTPAQQAPQDAPSSPGPTVPGAGPALRVAVNPVERPVTDVGGGAGEATADRRAEWSEVGAGRRAVRGSGAANSAGAVVLG
ncbi:hypothetical protein ACWCO7_10005, partial [Streptomyces violaceorubidus]